MSELDLSLPVEIRIWMVLKAVDLSSIPGRKVTDFLTEEEKVLWRPLDLENPPPWIFHQDLSELGLNMSRCSTHLSRNGPGTRIMLGSEEWRLDLDSLSRSQGKVQSRSCNECGRLLLAYSWVVEVEASVPVVGSRYRETYVEWLCPACHLRETWKDDWKNSTEYNQLMQENRDGGQREMLYQMQGYLSRRESSYLASWTRKDLELWRAWWKEENEPSPTID